jgi:hypothetical protein
MCIWRFQNLAFAPPNFLIMIHFMLPEAARFCLSLLMSPYVTQVQHDGREEWSASGALTQPGHHKFRQVPYTFFVSLMDLENWIQIWMWIRTWAFYLDPDLDPGVTIRARKNSFFSSFWSAGWSLLRAEGFSCSLYVLHRGLGINLMRIVKNFFPTVKFYNFWSSNLWIRIETNADSQYWWQVHRYILATWLRSLIYTMFGLEEVSVSEVMI